MKEIKEIIDMGRRLDELAFDTYSLFAKRDDFDKGLVCFWTEMAEWKKNHLKHWKKISKSFVYRNFFNRSTDDLKMIIKQLKNIQAEQVEFMRRLRKKKVSQDEAISQTILNEFCLITDIFLEIFYVYDETVEDRSTSFVEECESHLVKMANTLKPYLRLNPLYAVLLRSIVDLKHKYDYLLSTFRKMKKAAV
jgi:hypothetical protein